MAINKLTTPPANYKVVANDTVMRNKINEVVDESSVPKTQTVYRNASNQTVGFTFPDDTGQYLLVSDWGVGENGRLIGLFTVRGSNCYFTEILPGNGNTVSTSGLTMTFKRQFYSTLSITKLY